VPRCVYLFPVPVVPSGSRKEEKKSGFGFSYLSSFLPSFVFHVSLPGLEGKESFVVFVFFPKVHPFLFPPLSPLSPGSKYLELYFRLPPPSFPSPFSCPLPSPVSSKVKRLETILSSLCIFLSFFPPGVHAGELFLFFSLFLFLLFPLIAFPPRSLPDASEGFFFSFFQSFFLSSHWTRRGTKQTIFCFFFFFPFSSPARYYFFFM